MQLHLMRGPTYTALVHKCFQGGVALQVPRHDATYMYMCLRLTFNVPFVYSLVPDVVPCPPRGLNPDVITLMCVL